MQPSVVVHQHDEKIAGIVRGTAEHVPNPLRLLVFVRRETEHADVLRAQQDRLPPARRYLVVLRRRVHVALRHVVQLAYRSVCDGVALLLRGSVEDAERPNDRLLQDIRRSAAAE